MEKESSVNDTIAFDRTSLQIGSSEFRSSHVRISQLTNTGKADGGQQILGYLDSDRSFLHQQIEQIIGDGRCMLMREALDDDSGQNENFAFFGHLLNDGADIRTLSSFVNVALYANAEIIRYRQFRCIVERQYAIVQQKFHQRFDQVTVTLIASDGESVLQRLGESHSSYVPTAQSQCRDIGSSQFDRLLTGELSSCFDI